MVCCGVPTASNEKSCVLARSEANILLTPAVGQLSIDLHQNAHVHRIKTGSIYPTCSLGGSHSNESPTTPTLITPKQVAFNLGVV